MPQCIFLFCRWQLENSPEIKTVYEISANLKNNELLTNLTGILIIFIIYQGTIPLPYYERLGIQNIGNDNF